jgi:DMSO/TMAO reductase YedYZ molybdopterin-dependent catalytic subunit
MDRRTRSVNATLLALFVIAAASGGLAFALGVAPLATVVVVVHGASGFGLLVLIPAKSRIARRGMRRPGKSRKVISWTLSVLVAAALAGGLLHAVRGFVPVLGLLPMQIHVGAALAAAGLLAAHVLPHRHRRWPVVRPVDLDRRTALQAATVAVGGLALRAVAPGRERRFTGSHEVAALPVTQWLFDPVLALDPTAWRLRLPGCALDLAALAALRQTTVRAVIDCTGGWWAEEEWRGVRLADLGLSRASALDVVSATCYRRRLPASGVESVLLATHAGGAPLADGHGGPARLVVPGRRGFWWVKWVVAIEPTDEPWWWQPPLPLQ